MRGDLRRGSRDPRPPEPSRCPYDPDARSNELAAIQKRHQEQIRPKPDPHIYLAFVLACGAVGADLDEVRQRRRSLLRREDLLGQRYKIYVIMRNAGFSYPEIASAFGTSHATVYEALQRGPRRNGLYSCKYVLVNQPNEKAKKATPSKSA